MVGQERELASFCFQSARSPEMFYCTLAGQGTSSTRAELVAMVLALCLPDAVSVGSDSAAV
eukprot:3705109-Alexandrium_andersonii.AAC.1